MEKSLTEVLKKFYSLDHVSNWIMGGIKLFKIQVLFIICEINDSFLLQFTTPLQNETIRVS